jgi:hypothetical protein
VIGFLNTGTREGFAHFLAAFHQSLNRFLAPRSAGPPRGLSLPSNFAAVAALAIIVAHHLRRDDGHGSGRGARRLRAATMSDDRIAVSVTFDEGRGYVATAPELRRRLARRILRSEQAKDVVYDRVRDFEVRNRQYDGVVGSINRYGLHSDRVGRNENRLSCNRGVLVRECEGAIVKGKAGWVCHLVAPVSLAILAPPGK